MDLAAHDAACGRRNNASERGIRRNSWHRAADGLLFYLAPTIIFFIVAALSGMGSTFLPNTPWLNPAALALALPLPREVSYLVSYFVYFVELSLSLVLLFRVVGLAPLQAIICAQLYLLILFPPTNGAFVTLQWYSLAPVNAHLVAICNVLLALILITGRYGIWTNLICSVGVFFLLLCGLFSAPVTFLTYAPVYAVAGVALLLGAKPNAKELGWKVAAVLASGAVLWLLGFKDYLQGTSLISGRTSLYPAAFAAGADLLTWSYWRDAWTKFNTCAHPYFLCPRFPSFYIFIGSSMGAALYVFQRSMLRPLAFGMLLFFAFVYAFDFARSISLFGSAHAIGTPFLIWSSYPFTVLFLGLLIFRVARLIGTLLLAFSRPLRFNASLKAGVATYHGKYADFRFHSRRHGGGAPPGAGLRHAGSRRHGNSHAAGLYCRLGPARGRCGGGLRCARPLGGSGAWSEHRFRADTGCGQHAGRHSVVRRSSGNGANFVGGKRGRESAFISDTVIPRLGPADHRMRIICAKPGDCRRRPPAAADCV
jgi:hypothetical protein